MTKVLLGHAGTDPAAPAAVPAQAKETGWPFLALVGWLLALVAGMDLALLWFPLGFGNPEWEFGTTTSFMNGLPVLALGLALVMGSAVATGRRRTARSVAFLLVGLVLFVLLAAAMYATTIPLALRAVENPMVRFGLQKAIVKTLVEAALYSAAFGWLAVAGWRRTTRRNPNP